MSDILTVITHWVTTFGPGGLAVGMLLASALAAVVIDKEQK